MSFGEQIRVASKRPPEFLTCASGCFFALSCEGHHPCRPRDRVSQT
jgi:hypothetical protein